MVLTKIYRGSKTLLAEVSVVYSKNGVRVWNLETRNLSPSDVEFFVDTFCENLHEMKGHRDDLVQWAKSSAAIDISHKLTIPYDAIRNFLPHIV